MSAIPVRGGRIKKNKRGSDRFIDYRTLCETGFGESIRIACAIRIEMSKEEVTAANFCNASTSNLLIIRSYNIRSVYERLWRCHIDGDKVPSLYDSKERDDDENSIFKESCGYIAQHTSLLRTFVQS